MNPKKRLNPADHYNAGEKELERFDPAWAKAALFFRSNCVLHFGHGEDSFRMAGLLAIHEQLEARRKRYEAGESMELLHAINQCAEENLPMPTWLALAFKKRFSSLGQIGGPTSLDAVFTSTSMPTRTPKKAAQAQQDWQLGGMLWRAVWAVASKHNGLDKAVDEVLSAGNFGVEKTTAKKLVLMIDKNQNELIGQQTLSQFWAKRRKDVT